MLEKLIQDDVAAAKTPTLLIGFAGIILFHVLGKQNLFKLKNTKSMFLSTIFVPNPLFLIF